MQPPVERVSGPDENIGGYSQAPQETVSPLRYTVARLMSLGENHQQIVIAVFRGVAARLGPKEVYALGVERVRDSPDRLG